MNLQIYILHVFNFQFLRSNKKIFKTNNIYISETVRKKKNLFLNFFYEIIVPPCIRIYNQLEDETVLPKDRLIHMEQTCTNSR